MGEAIASDEAGRVVRYAGFWRRLAAYIIDCILAGIVAYSFAVVGALLIELPSGERLDGLALNIATMWIFGCFLIAPWLYWALMESSNRQATLGKRVLGIIVTDIEGRRVTFVRGTVRYWAKVISFLILLIGFMLAGFTSRKQALHDIISNCLVVVKQ
ncbi:MAG: RDD family protein [Dehalococcoidia bacterium]|jgi:uncharacterized RDD family membrane protein YckC|nr:RDD family protein [Dehalococcoidia bacterium]